LAPGIPGAFLLSEGEFNRTRHLGRKTCVCGIYSPYTQNFSGEIFNIQPACGGIFY
jgi:hypothetical protein